MHIKSSRGIVQNRIFGLLGTFLLLLFFPLHWILLQTAWTASHSQILHFCCKMHEGWEGMKDGRAWLTRKYAESMEPRLSAKAAPMPPPLGAFPLANYICGGHQPFLVLLVFSRNTQQSHCWICGDVWRNGKGVQQFPQQPSSFPVVHHSLPIPETTGVMGQRPYSEDCIYGRKKMFLFGIW